MTIRQAIDEVTANQPNSRDEAWMIKWLSRCEAMLDSTIVQRYRCHGERFAGFDEDTDEETELLAWEPHDSLYVYWMEAQLHYGNGDIDRYNNAISMFNREVEAFRREYLRRHEPVRRIRFRF